MSAQIRDIRDINTGDLAEGSANPGIMSYVYSWSVILTLFYTVVFGALILYQFSCYFQPNYRRNKYHRSPVDDTNYLAIGLVSLVLGASASAITLWIFSKTR